MKLAFDLLRTHAAGAAACALWWSVATTVADQPIVYDIQGRDLRAPGVESLDEKGVQFTAEPKLLMSWEELIVWGALQDHRRGKAVYLNDGSRIIASHITIDEDRLLVTRPLDVWPQQQLWQQVECTRRVVRGIVLHPSSVIEEQDRWWNVFAQDEPAQDTLHLLNGDYVQGILLGWDQQNKPATVRMQTTAGILSVAETEAAAIRLRTSPLAVSPPKYVIGFRDGSVLYLHAMDKAGDHIQLRLADGVLRAAIADVMESVCYVRSLVAPVQYMSQSEPTGYRHIPFLTTSWPYRVNSNVLGGRLRSPLGWYDNGLGFHATCRIAYPVPQGAERWEAEAAIDRTAAPQATATVRVYVHRQGEFQLAAQTALLRVNSPPHPLRVDVRNCSQLAIIVDAADGWDVGDRVNLLVPRFVMK